MMIYPIFEKKVSDEFYLIIKPLIFYFNYFFNDTHHLIIVDINLNFDMDREIMIQDGMQFHRKCSASTR